MKKILLSMVAIAALATPILAHAEVTRTTSTSTSTRTVRQSPTFLGFQGPYVSFDAGLSAPQDLDGTATITGTDFDTSFDLDNDVLFSGAFGVRITPQIRTELEIAYRNNDVDSVNVAGAGSIAGSGDVELWNFMANAYYDFQDLDLGQRTRIVPYLMGGIGAATLDGSESDTAFAYQLGAGVSLPFAERTAFTVGYRWLDTSDFSLSSGGVSFDGDYQEHQVRAGIRYEF